MQGTYIPETNYVPRVIIIIIIIIIIILLFWKLLS